MKRWHKWGIGLGVCSVAIVSLVVVYYANPSEIFGLRPHSDLKIETDIGWWPYQDKVTISDFTAEAVNPVLNLFRHEFIVRYHIKGSVQADPTWRPYLASAHVTTRLSQARKNGEINTHYADTHIIPIVQIKEDEKYSGQPIPFDVTIEHVQHTMGWGQNIYTAKCLGTEREIKVSQTK
ncbi:MAG: hypothetical protein IT367_13825 [Candidatus Hydrogenedentes bacterium]|nr:hypothetical protein [Candidatus Hydrogenedentota bacterium]